MFIGSIRYNIDPLKKYTDKEIWNALRDVKLYDHVNSLKNKLDTKVGYESSIFSVGQKQLICLARVVLMDNKIIFLDEATANVDFETDQFIQNTLKKKFRKHTVFTIAHRLSTIMDYDKVVVMDNGKVVEFGDPYLLIVKDTDDDGLTRQDGVLTSMILETGEESSRALF